VKGDIGSGEKALKAVFARARRSAPCLIFIDEIQAVFSKSNSSNFDVGSGSGQSQSSSMLTSALVSCFDDINIWNENIVYESGGGGRTGKIMTGDMAEKQGEKSYEIASDMNTNEWNSKSRNGGKRIDGTNNISKLITVLAATNEPWAIDLNLIRSGRFERVVLVTPLDYESRLQYLKSRLLNDNTSTEARPVLDHMPNREFEDNLDSKNSNKSIFSTHSKRRDILEASVNLEHVASRTEGYTGADMDLFVRKCLARAYCQGRNCISAEDVVVISEKLLPSVTKQDMGILRDWISTFRNV